MTKTHSISLITVFSLLHSSASLAHHSHGNTSWNAFMTPMNTIMLGIVLISLLSMYLLKKTTILHSCFTMLDKAFHFKTASAHCDIPCKIYDPSTAQIAALSVIRMMDILQEIDEDSSKGNHAELVRLVQEKEKQASIVKDEIRIIWGDYIKQPQIDDNPEIHELVHSIMMQASQCKQHINRDMGLVLLKLVNHFAQIFWKTKDISTYVAKCPYPPAEPVIYPDLNSGE